MLITISMQTTANCIYVLSLEPLHSMWQIISATLRGGCQLTASFLMNPKMRTLFSVRPPLLVSFQIPSFSLLLSWVLPKIP